MAKETWIDYWKQRIYGPGPSGLLPEATIVEEDPSTAIPEKGYAYLETIKQKTWAGAEAERLEIERARAEALPECLAQVRAMIEHAAGKGHCRIEVNGRSDGAFWDKNPLTLDVLKEHFPGFEITRDSRYDFQFEIRWLK